MAQSTPTNLYCSRASFRCAYMHHIEKYVFQQESAAPGSGLLLEGRELISTKEQLIERQLQFAQLIANRCTSRN